MNLEYRNQISKSTISRRRERTMLKGQIKRKGAKTQRDE
jgi:hypothetical protein